MDPGGLVERLRALFRVASRRSHRGQRGLGQAWERLAERRLAASGYVILERNFRGRSGEIDLVAEESGVLCFVEVKGRSGPGFGAPEEAVTLEKQRRIARAAQEYLWRRRVPSSTRCRFDVVAVAASGESPEISIFRDAFPLPERLLSRRVLN